MTADTRRVPPFWPVALLAAVAPGLAPAQLPSALEGCLRLETESERLRCYDTVLGRTPTEMEAPDEPPPEPEPPAQADAEAPVPPPPSSPLAKRWQLIAPTDRGPFVITPYKPTYVLPVSWNFRSNSNPEPGARDRLDNIQNLELKFQLSFKAKLLPELLTERGDLWFGYTQLSFWQAYNNGESRPFRETNFEPELIYSYRTAFPFLGLTGRLLTLSLNHHSNGRSDPFSRSWNRVIGGVLLDRHNFALSVRGWWRIPESADQDDNPDISSFYGRGEIGAFYQREDQTFAAIVRSNFELDTPRVGLQLDWSFPLGGVKGYVQAFSGYGDGLIDFDHISHRLSAGFMLTDWM